MTDIVTVRIQRAENGYVVSGGGEVWAADDIQAAQNRAADIVHRALVAANPPGLRPAAFVATYPTARSATL